MHTKLAKRQIVVGVILASLWIPVSETCAQESSDSAASSNHGVELYISEDALQVSYIRQTYINELGDVDLRGGIFLNESRDLVGVADILSEVADPERFSRWTFRIGPRLYGALLNLENQDIFSIGFGGEASLALGQNQTVTLHLSGFYAPDILTFGEADNVVDVGVRAEMQLNEQLIGFIGYRNFEFDLPRARDREVDSGLHLGFRRRF